MIQSARSRAVCLSVALLLVFLLSVQFIYPVCAANAIQEARSGVVLVFSLWRARYTLELGGGTGTGFFVGEAGKPVEYVVTNKHVVLGDQEEYELDAYESVVLLDGAVYSVSKIILSPKCDLAILRLESPVSSRKAMVLGSSDTIDITDTVYTLGFPDYSQVSDDRENLPSDVEDITVTKGSVNRKNVTTGGVDHIQHDATISHGNSGGPLVTEDGAVIAVNTWSYTAGGSSSAFYSIDIKYVKEFLRENGISFETAEDPTEATTEPVTESETEPATEPTSEAMPSKPSAATETAPTPQTQPAASAEKPTQAPSENQNNDDSWVLILGVAVIAVGVLVTVLAVAMRNKKRKAASDEDDWEPASTSPAAKPADDDAPDVTVAMNRPPTGSVRILSGAMKGAVIPIDEGQTLWLGKDPKLCNVVFESQFQHISRMHCSVVYMKQMYYVMDNSSNGTMFQNGQRLPKGVRVTARPGTELFLANNDCCIRLE